MKKILVLGSSGQLGEALKKYLIQWSEVKFLNRNEVDFENVKSSEKIIKNFKPNFIVNAVAYTNVDNAENSQEKAFLINAHAVGQLSELANSYDAAFIHYSTDYVFDGKKNVPYTETDTPNPLSIYGKSKLEGELLIKKNCSKFLIIRTSGVISKNNDNFLSKIKTFSESKKNLSIIDDQITSLNYSEFISKGTSKMLEKLENNLEKEKRWGTYHMSGKKPGSWFDFACYAQKKIQIFDPTSALASSMISPIKSKDFNQKARRPHYSFLSSNKLEKEFDIKLPNWEKSISQVIK